jgi:excinuclease UvrABC nuclease subunit
VRARKLYDTGFKTVKSVGEASFSELAQILGEGIAKSVKKELSK